MPAAGARGLTPRTLSHRSRRSAQAAHDALRCPVHAPQGTVRQLSGTQLGKGRPMRAGWIFRPAWRACVQMQPARKTGAS